MRGLAAVLALSLGGCQAVAGLSDFAPDDGATSATSGSGGAGGAGGAGPASGGGPASSGASSSDASSSSSSDASSASSSASTGGGGGGCPLDHLVIAEVRTRGPVDTDDDGAHDFVEILNPTSSAVALDATFRLEARGESSGAYGIRWTSDGSLTIPPGGRVLLANDAPGNPLGGETPDGTYGSGIPDGASVLLYQGETVVDAVCFTCEEASLEGFLCEGAPLVRPAGCELPGDRSVQRRAAHGLSGCVDTGDNAADLEDASPATPEGL